MAKRPSQKIRKTLADLTKALRRLEAPNMVIGGIAVIAHGVARQTIDVDATILATRLDASQILAALAGCSIHPRIPNVLEFAESSQVLLLVHETTQVTLEVSFAFSSFEQGALERAVVGRGCRRSLHDMRQPRHSRQRVNVSPAVPDRALLYRSPASRPWTNTSRPAGMIRGSCSLRGPLNACCPNNTRATAPFVRRRVSGAGYNTLPEGFPSVQSQGISFPCLGSFPPVGSIPRELACVPGASHSDAALRTAAVPPKGRESGR